MMARRHYALLPLLPMLVGANSAATTAWQTQTDTDLVAMASTIRDWYIHAVYPDPAAFGRELDENLRLARAEVPLVKDFGGYRAVIQHFGVSFHDAHLRARFALAPVKVKWPGFLVRYQAGGYRTGGAVAPGVANDAAVTACDGRSIAQLVEKVAAYEIGLPPALETTRTDAALRLFVDRGSPLYPLPKRCVIGGRDTLLTWSERPEAEVTALARRLRGPRDDIVDTQLLNDGGAWVRLGYFSPNDATQAAAFHKAIADAPSLRKRKYVVLDVRGNGGGPYNWFMAYLRSFYGQSYADYYATARLHIRAVYRLTPAIAAREAETEQDAQDLHQPPDPPVDMTDASPAEIKQAAANGAAYYRGKSASTSRPGPPPVNPVAADVYVLTDYGCASACIAFIDELRNFPGVTQIGLPTFVDSRSGTAYGTLLPSGLASVEVATMTRDGRVRDDNVPNNPSITYPGDTADTTALKRWVARLAADRAHPAPSG